VERTDSLELIPNVYNGGRANNKAFFAAAGSGGRIRRPAEASYSGGSAGGGITMECGPYSPVNGIAPHGSCASFRRMRSPPPSASAAAAAAAEACEPLLRPSPEEEAERDRPKRRTRRRRKRSERPSRPSGSVESSTDEEVEPERDEEEDLDEEEDAFGDSSTLEATSGRPSPPSLMKNGGGPIVAATSADPYVPPGYIILDHRGGRGRKAASALAARAVSAGDFAPSSVSSV